jgi:hypothetical protein
MTTDERIDKLASLIEERFNGIDARFERVDAAIASVNTYVLNFRSETSQRFEAIEHRLDLMAGTLTAVEAYLPIITKAMLSAAALGTQFVLQKSVTNDIASRVAILEEQVSRLLNPAA